MTETETAPAALHSGETQTGTSTAGRRLRAACWGVVAVFLVHGLIVSTWVSRIAAVKAALGLSEGTLGLALLGAAIGSLTAIPMAGWAAARFGSRKTVLFTAAGFALSLLLLAFSPNLIALSAALLIYGGMAGANDVAINAQAVGVEKQLGTPVMSRFHAMFSLGAIVGAGFGGFLASRGISPSIHFVALSAAILTIVFVSRALLIDTEGTTSARMPFKKPPMALITLSAIGFCIFLSEGAIADWTAVYITEVLHAGEGLAGIGYAVFSAAMTVFRLGGDAITAYVGRAWIVRGGALVAAVGMLAVVLADTPSLALAGFAAAGAGFSSIIPVVFAAGGRIRGVTEAAGVATVSGIGYLGFLVGPPVIGLVSELTSLRAGLFLLVVLSLLAASLVSLVERTSNPEANPIE